MSERCAEMTAHYVSNWKNEPAVRRPSKGPTWELPADFCVLEFPPTQSRDLWTYATCGMSQPGDDSPIELHLFSPQQSDELVELLTAVAHYHRTGHRLGLGHTANFGRPWLPTSPCEYGLISLPYLDGPSLEECKISQSSEVVRCLWLIPITKKEREYKITYGLESLEQKFEEANFNYADPNRSSVV
jgi:hypothetical protein